MRLLCISPLIFIAETQQHGSHLLQPNPAHRPLRVESSRSDCPDFVNLSVGYRPIAVIRQQ
jgi:hypothetical protein